MSYAYAGVITLGGPVQSRHPTVLSLETADRREANACDTTRILIGARNTGVSRATIDLLSKPHEDRSDVQAGNHPAADLGVGGKARPVEGERSGNAEEGGELVIGADRG